MEEISGLVKKFQIFFFIKTHCEPLGAALPIKDL